MTTLNAMIEKLDKGVVLHMQSFYYDAEGQNITKDDYLKLKANDNVATSKTMFTSDFTTEEKVNRFGKTETVTVAKDNAEWIASNKVESLTVQTKVAGIAGLTSKTYRYLKEDMSDRQVNELRLIRFKMSATANLNKLIDIHKSIKSLVAAPNARPIKDFKDLSNVLANDKTRLINQFADLNSEIADMLMGNSDDTIDANIF